MWSTLEYKLFRSLARIAALGPKRHQDDIFFHSGGIDFGEGFRLNNNRLLIVRPDIQVAFNRLPKCASTSTTHYLKDVPGRLGHSRRLKKFRDLSEVQLHLLKSYRRILVVRNPYSRLLSAFLEKARPEKALVSGLEGPLDLTPSGFARFVDLLEDGTVGDNKHWAPMVNLLVWPPDSYTAILKSENLGSEWPRFVEDIGLSKKRLARPEAPHPIDVMKPGKVTGATDRVRDFYTPAVARKVAAMYREDFVTFSYSEDFASL